MTYSVSLFFTKRVPPNIISESLTAYIVTANNKDEALGIGIRLALEDIGPDYSLEYHLTILIPQS